MCNIATSRGRYNEAEIKHCRKSKKKNVQWGSRTAGLLGRCRSSWSQIYVKPFPPFFFFQRTGDWILATEREMVITLGNYLDWDIPWGCPQIHIPTDTNMDWRWAMWIYPHMVNTNMDIGNWTRIPVQKWIILSIDMRFSLASTPPLPHSYQVVHAIPSPPLNLALMMSWRHLSNTYSLLKLKSSDMGIRMTVLVPFALYLILPSTFELRDTGGP